MRKAYKFRLSPTKQQEKTLFWTLTRCRELYNAALAERKEAYRMAGKSITYYEQKRDFHHKQARHLVKQHQTMVFEELEITNLSKRAKPKQDEGTGQYLPNGAAAKSGLNKSILDAGWGQFQQIVTHKAACAGRMVLKVNPRIPPRCARNAAPCAQKTSPRDGIPASVEQNLIGTRMPPSTFYGLEEPNVGQPA